MKLSKLFGITVMVFLLGCQDDELITPIEGDATDTDELVSLKRFNEARLLNLKVDWGASVRREMDGVVLEEWSILDDTKMGQYRILKVTEGDSEKFFVLLFRSSVALDNLSYINGGDEFTGTINWLDMSGDIVALEAYENGTRLNLTKSEDIGKTIVTNLKSNDCGGTVWKTDLNKEGKLEAKDECDWVYTGGGGGYYITVRYYTWTDWYYDRGGEWEYAYRTDYKVTFAREWVSNGRDYANAGVLIGGVNNRLGNRGNGRIIKDVAT